MKKLINLEVDYDGHERCVLTNVNGDTFTFEINTRNGIELDCFLLRSKKVYPVTIYEYRFKAKPPNGGYVTDIIEAVSRDEAKKIILKKYNEIIWINRL